MIVYHHKGKLWCVLRRYLHKLDVHARSLLAIISACLPCRYMPIQDGPFLMKDSLEDPHHTIDRPMPVGLVREFTVRRLSSCVSPPCLAFSGPKAYSTCTVHAQVAS